ncbi:MAG: Gfo/Idh/MocA family oxidoreductase [Deltaproteobacteria bacterium]|nr:Gfo/Idh/MocA family oxidoreductase [Deltaproteobacteria bacterium]
MKKIRTAVIGTGYLGKFHAEKYAELDNSELIAVVDINKDNAEAVAKKTNTTALNSYESLLTKVDAVSIVTPTETHAKIGLDFLSRGIDVLIEKPMALSTAEADTLIKAAEENNAILQIGHLERFNGAVLALKDTPLDPVFIESHRLSPFPNRSTDVDVVLDLMIHDIDIILNLARAEVEKIDAVGIPVISGKVDIANARLEFKNGCVANVTASRVSKEPQRKMRIFQNETYISVDFATQQISIAKLEGAKDGEKPRIINEELQIERQDSLLEEIKSFLNCSATREAPLVSGSDGKRALAVAAEIQEAVEESIQKRKQNIK